MKEIYIFSGLGADERAFQELDFSGFPVQFIRWMTTNIHETISQYATRLIQQIKTENPTLIGLSFGGIMAVEVAKQIKTDKVILIASAKTKYEIPFYFRFAGYLKLHKLMPAALLKHANFITYWSFGAVSPAEKRLLKQILSDTDPTFLKWAIDKIVSWSNTTKLNNLIHIHGTDDRILPYKFVTCDLTIKNGGHLMTINRHEEITLMLRSMLNKR